MKRLTGRKHEVAQALKTGKPNFAAGKVLSIRSLSADISTMIEVTRLNGEKYFLNPALIETIESRPDTVIKLTTDKKLIVKEDPSDIINRIIEYNRNIFLDKYRTK